MEQNYGKEEFQTQHLFPNQKPNCLEIKVKFLSWNQSVRVRISHGQDFTLLCLAEFLYHTQNIRWNFTN